ncbi:DUF5958 family protein [Streptomyces sp. Isolate_45]|uniref:DUF5958 family protein n=1 Tax=Streptomyces sp. Isolate_45 TaxID=2950111 RepID=UPI0024820F01|nr:DUF5958 family protein [Streptomyces sp. Isolate_45]MDA5285929.1 DUF5958 family protein [Streptomyces sp. Isolate_45]
MDERTVMLNMLAQELRPIEQGVEWFEALPAETRFEVLQDLREYCIQAAATEEDGPESVRRAGLRPTHTPAVLITRGQPNVQLPKIIALPQDERVKSFRLLVALLGVADDRRRERFCVRVCNHAWHRLASGADPGTATA